MKYYEEWGYVPDGRKDVEGMHTTGASMTLEYAYQDWCLAQMAKTMGKLQDYEFFMKRSKNYRNLWNPESGYMQPRGEDGNWLPCFDPLELTEKGGFCESNSAIYSHYVPHDMAGLIELYGGADQYVKRLNANFEKSESYGFSVLIKQRKAIGQIMVISRGLEWLICLVMQEHLGLLRSGCVK